MRVEHDQRGMSGSVQAVVLLPVTIGVFLSLLQWSLQYWGEATALAAAQQGAAVAAAFGGSRADGEREAAGVAANGALTGVRVSVERGGRVTTATVSGRTVTVVWPREVARTVMVTTERVTGS
ncbi:hypothetical protein [Tessaracoccus sp. Z1128]